MIQYCDALQRARSNSRTLVEGRLQRCLLILTDVRMPTATRLQLEDEPSQKIGGTKGDDEVRVEQAPEQLANPISDKLKGF